MAALTEKEMLARDLAARAVALGSSAAELGLAPAAADLVVDLCEWLRTKAGLNEEVNGMVSCALSSARQPQVQAAACGDKLDLSRASQEQIQAWAKAAAGGAYVEVLHKLMKAGASPTGSVQGGLTPLMAAGQGGQVESIKILLQYISGGTAGIKKAMNYADKDGDTALLLAAAGGRVDVIRMLIDNGAMVDTPNAIGNTPLLELSLSCSSLVGRLRLPRPRRVCLGLDRAPG